MSDWYGSDTTRYCAIGTVEQTQSSRGTGIAPGGVNTKGNYAELISNTPFDAHGLILHVTGPVSAANRALTDIATAPQGGTQTVIIHNLHTDGIFANIISSFHFPISIPAQTQISARVQNSGGAAHVRLAGHLYSCGLADLSPFGKVVTYGASTSDSGGTEIDPGGTAGVKGSWVQITSSTTSPIVKMVIAIGGDSNSARVNTSWLFDLGIGSAGSEQVVQNNIPLVFNDAHILPRVIGPFSISIPAATRIAVRAQCTNADATDRLFDVVLYGIS